MEVNREPRKNGYKYAQLIFEKVQKQFNRDKTASLTNGTREIVYPQAKY